MGGYGSGSNTTNGKEEVENCRILSLSYLLQHGLLKPGLMYRLTWNNVLGSHLYTLWVRVTGPADTLRLLLQNINQFVNITTTPAPIGGQRLWLACPRCGCRAYKLYLPPCTGRFYCRKCHNLTYQSCRESHTSDSLWARIGAQCGLTADEVKRTLSQYRRSRKPKWRRKRDRRPDYRGREARLREIMDNGAIR